MSRSLPGVARAGTLVRFRRDLRDFDHAALANALQDGAPVYAAFVFDREILDPLPSRSDRRVEFILDSVRELDSALRARGGGLLVRHGFAREEIPALADALQVLAVFANRDYEPSALARDADVAQALLERGIAFTTSRDHVIRERDDLLTQTGRPYGVFTPYRNAWLHSLEAVDLAPHDVDANADALRPPPRELDTGVPSLAFLGFEPTNLREIGVVPGMSGAAKLFANFRRRIGVYKRARDFPAVKGPSYLSVHLRFGTVSIRELVAFAHARSLEVEGEGAATWLSELVWREFYAQVLWHHPHVVTHAFQRAYDTLRFPNDPAKFSAWRQGRTGFPLVDAAMRQLNTTGYMHNRLRMVTASFLVKDLLVDWRWGEKYFAEQLIDFELASNNGGWQWAASTGCDAQPWFRIFNPVTQSERFDASGTFIRRYVPELKALDAKAIHAPWRASPEALKRAGVALGRGYPEPVVDHALAREQALALFNAVRDREAQPR